MIDKGTLDAVLSLGGSSGNRSTASAATAGNDDVGDDDGTSSPIEAMNRAKMMVSNSLLALKTGHHMIIFSNLPPEMALPFFSECTTEVEAISSFEPNGRKKVKLGEFVKAAREKKTVTVYKLTATAAANGDQNRAQKLEALKSLKDSLTKGVDEARRAREEVNVRTEEARQDAENAKEEVS